jgi:ankyrin repeat protein
MLTEIYLCHACSCHEIEDGKRPGRPTHDGTAPFHWAVWQGQTRVCEMLIELGADWRACNEYGCNAVQWAALAGNVAMCEWLQRLGLDLLVLNRNGHSALHKAAVKGQRAVCEWLLRARDCTAPALSGGGGLGWPQLQADGDGNSPG